MNRFVIRTLFNGDLNENWYSSYGASDYYVIVLVTELWLRCCWNSVCGNGVGLGESGKDVCVFFSIFCGSTSFCYFSIHGISQY